MLVPFHSSIIAYSVFVKGVGENLLFSAMLLVVAKITYTLKEAAP